MQKLIKLQADAINGIYLVNDLNDHDGCEVLEFSDFFEDLDSLDAERVIGCEVTEAQLEQLEQAWGVSA